MVDGILCESEGLYREHCTDRDDCIGFWSSYMPCRHEYLNRIVAPRGGVRGRITTDASRLPSTGTK